MVVISFLQASLSFSVKDTPHLKHKVAAEFGGGGVNI